MLQLLITGQLEVKDIVIAPDFVVGAAASSHVLTHEQSLGQQLEVLSSITVDESNLGESRLAERCVVSLVNPSNHPLGHVTDELEVEARNEVVIEFWTDYLAQCDPVH